MPDTNLPPAERTPSEGQRKGPTCFGLLVIIVLFSVVGYVLGIALLGLVDLWSEKFRPELRQDIRSLRPFIGYGGAAVSAIVGIILAFIPGRPRGEQDSKDHPPS